MATASELARAVALRLRKIDPSDVSPYDGEDDILAAITRMRALLVEKGLCWWDAAAIPDAVMIPLEKLVACEVADALGKTADPAWKFEGRQDLNEIGGTQTRPVQTAEFF